MKTLNFYQVNDPKHKTYNVRSWLRFKCPHLMATSAQSSCINSIENLSSYLDLKIRNHTISSKNDLERAFRDEWGKFDFCEKFLHNMPHRLKMMVKKKNKGMHTKY